MEHGKITAVNYDKGVVKCNVKGVRVSNEYRDVPVMKPYSGTIRMPKPGQKAVMDVLNDGTRFIVGYIAREDERPSSLGNGEMTIQVDADTTIALTQNADGNWDLDLTASGNLNVNAANGDVAVQAPSGAVDVDGDTVTIDGTTNVKIDGIDFDQHTHPYTDEDTGDTGDGSASTTTANKTTDPPQ
jgi:hypothetical protein